MLAETSIFWRQLASIVLCLPAVISGAYILSRTIVLRRWMRGTARIISFGKGPWENPSAVIRFSYSVAGRDYEGTRISVSDFYCATGLGPVKRLERRYPVGSETAVYYDPRCPERSVLRRPGYALAAFLLFLGVGGGVFLVCDAGNRNTPPPGWHPYIHIPRTR